MRQSGHVSWGRILVLGYFVASQWISLGIYSTKMGTDQFDDMVLKKTHSLV